ncbi:MAG: hypothetical protein AB7F66_17580, partial [Bacteriovoracia bacterium]
MYFRKIISMAMAAQFLFVFDPGNRALAEGGTGARIAAIQERLDELEADRAEAQKTLKTSDRECRGLSSGRTSGSRDSRSRRGSRGRAVAQPAGGVNGYLASACDCRPSKSVPKTQEKRGADGQLVPEMAGNAPVRDASGRVVYQRENLVDANNNLVMEELRVGSGGCSRSLFARIGITTDAQLDELRADGQQEASCVQLFEAQGHDISWISGACAQSLKACPSIKAAMKIDEACDAADAAEEELEIIKEEIKAAQLELNSIRKNCPNCELMEAMKPREPKFGDYAIAALPAIMGGVGMGLNAWLGAKWMGKYSGMYGDYLNQCATIGVPCGPPGIGGGGGFGWGGGGGFGTFGGPFGGGMYGGPFGGVGGGIYGGPFGGGMGGVYGGPFGGGMYGGPFGGVGGGIYGGPFGGGVGGGIFGGIGGGIFAGPFGGGMYGGPFGGVGGGIYG